MSEVGGTQSADTGSTVGDAGGWSGGGDNDARAFDTALSAAGDGQAGNTGLAADTAEGRADAPATPQPEPSPSYGSGPDDAAKAGALTPFDLAWEAFERALGLMGRGALGLGGAGMVIEGLRPGRATSTEELAYEQERHAAIARQQGEEAETARIGLAEADPFLDARRSGVPGLSGLDLPVEQVPAAAPRASVGPEGPAILIDPVPAAPPAMLPGLPAEAAPPFAVPGLTPVPEVVPGVVPGTEAVTEPGWTEGFSPDDRDPALIAAARPPDPLPALQAIRDASVFAERRSAWIYERGDDKTEVDRDRDFMSLPVSNIRPGGPNVTIGDLPDGRRAIARPSDEGPPTLEIQRPDGRTTDKFRYGPRPSERAAARLGDP
jgi:hypothetical protein